MIIDRPTADDVPALREIWREAFGDGEAFLDGFFSTTFSPERARVARIGDTIAGMLYWFDCEVCGEKCAYIYAVATVKAHRGRGVCKALMEDTHSYLKDIGYRSAILVPGSRELFYFYNKIGYEVCSSVTEIGADASDTVISVIEIERTEYALLRRQYLPPCGVIQEGVCLDFLNSYAKLYKGDDFILAAYKTGDMLIGVELLGNTTVKAVAAIAKSLGATRTRVRTAGDEKPFAMYYPFQKEACKPSYFGLAFD